MSEVLMDHIEASNVADKIASVTGLDRQSFVEPVKVFLNSLGAVNDVQGVAMVCSRELLRPILEVYFLWSSPLDVNDQDQGKQRNRASLRRIADSLSNLTRS